MHGKGLEPLCLAAAEPKAEQEEASFTIRQDSAGLEMGEPPVGAGLLTPPPHFAAASGPTDAALEHGVLDALARGLDGVSRTLAALLDERRRVRLPANVLPFPAERAR